MAVPVIVQRTFQLEFVCDGSPFGWVGAAINTTDAENKARRALYLGEAGFFNSTAVLVRCEEVKASDIPEDRGVRCHGDACCAGQLECPTPWACGVR